MVIMITGRRTFPNNSIGIGSHVDYVALGQITDRLAPLTSYRHLGVSPFSCSSGQPTESCILCILSPHLTLCHKLGS